MPKKVKRKKTTQGLRWRATPTVRHIPRNVMSFLIMEHLKERNKHPLGRNTHITEASYEGVLLVVISSKELPIPYLMTQDEFNRTFPEEIGKSIFDTDEGSSAFSTDGLE